MVETKLFHANKSRCKETSCIKIKWTSPSIDHLSTFKFKDLPWITAGLTLKIRVAVGIDNQQQSVIISLVPDRFE